MILVTTPTLVRVFFWYDCDSGKQVLIGPRFGKKPSDPMRAVSICCLRNPNEVCCGRTRGRERRCPTIAPNGGAAAAGSTCDDGEVRIGLIDLVL